MQPLTHSNISNQQCLEHHNQLTPINNFKAEENKSYGSALSPGQMLSLTGSRLVTCLCSIVLVVSDAEAYWDADDVFFSLVSQMGCGKHNSLSGYDSKRHLSILAVPAHLAFQWHLKLIIASFILVDKQTKVADGSLFPFCHCQKVWQMIPIICLKPNP